MDDHLKGLKMMMDRRTNMAVPLYANGELSPEMLEGIQKLGDAVLSAERSTGFTFDNIIDLPKKEASIGSLEYATPKLTIGQHYLRSEPSYTQNELEGLVLHELGHKNYHPTSQFFGNARAVEDHLGDIVRMRNRAEKDPEAFAAAIFRRYEPGVFAEDIDQLVEQLLERGSSLTATGNAARGATPEQCAAWFAQSHREVMRNGRLADNPLALYAQVPSISSETDYLLSKVKFYIQRPQSTAELATARERQQILDAVESASRRAGLFRWDMVQTIRGEEFLCDDFAVMHATDPRAVATLMEKGLSGNIDYTHPYMGARMERAASLAEEVVKARDRLAQTAAAMGGSLAEGAGKVTYGGWVEKMAEAAQRAHLHIWH